MIIFHSLTRENIHKIIDLELVKLFKRIGDLGYHATITEKAKDFIVDKGYDEKFGARPLKRAIQKYIEDPMAEQIIQANLQEGDTIFLDIEENATELKIDIQKGKKDKKVTE
jgi:ATP-dependent Clp protease ATP-binding subunit ClpC